MAPKRNSAKRTATVGEPPIQGGGGDGDQEGEMGLAEYTIANTIRNAATAVADEFGPTTTPRWQLKRRAATASGTTKATKTVTPPGKDRTRAATPPPTPGEASRRDERHMDMDTDVDTGVGTLPTSPPCNRASRPFISDLSLDTEVCLGPGGSEPPLGKDIHGGNPFTAVRELVAVNMSRANPVEGTTSGDPSVTAVASPSMIAIRREPAAVDCSPPVVTSFLGPEPVPPRGVKPTAALSVGSSQHSPPEDEPDDIIFTGDVVAFAARLVQQAVVPTSTEDVELDRALLWSNLGAIDGIAPSVGNRRVATAIEDAAAQFDPRPEPKKKQDEGRQEWSASSRSTGAAAGEGGSAGIAAQSASGTDSDTSQSPSKTRRREDGLAKRAEKVVATIKDHPLRVLGVLARGATNKPWATAVARALVKTGMGEGRITTWAGLVRDQKNKPREFALGVKRTVLAWAAAGRLVYIENAREDALVSGDDDRGLAEQSDTAARALASAFCEAVVLGPGAAGLKREKVCPWCVAGELSHYTFPPPQPKEEGPRTGGFAHILTSMPMGMGWLHAAARAHNREMHALNGNGSIDAPYAAEQPREERYDFLRAGFLFGPTQAIEAYPNQASRVTRAVRAAPQLYYARRFESGDVALAQAGTIHQFWGEVEVINEFFADDPEEGDVADTEMDEAVGTDDSLEDDEIADTGPPAMIVGATDPEEIVGQKRPVAGLGGSGRPPKFHCGGKVGGRPPTVAEEPATEEQPDSRASTPVDGATGMQFNVVVDDVVAEGEAEQGPRGDQPPERTHRTERLREVADGVLAALGGPDRPHGQARRREAVMGVLLQKQDDLRSEEDVPAEATTEADEARGEDLAEITRHIRWSALGMDSGRYGAKLLLNQNAEDMISASTVKGDVNTNLLLNAAKSKYITGYTMNTPNVAMLAKSTAESVRPDLRGPMLRVDLYDDLREDRLLQPTGVDYAWAAPEVPRRRITSLHEYGDWSYRAIFIDLEMLNIALREGGKVRVDRFPQNDWSLSDSKVKVIPVPENVGGASRARDVWIASQLTYPLVLVSDQFNVQRIGADVPVEQEFLRTSCLVDIHDPAEKLVFVTNSKNTLVITIGGTNYSVVTTDHQGERPRGDIPVYDINDSISRMVTNLLFVTTSLRTEFEQYVCRWMGDRLDWATVNNLSVVLTSRWPAKIERSLVPRAGRRPPLDGCIGAPASILYCLDLDVLSGANLESTEEYGGRYTVNPMDQRFVARAAARSMPMVSVGVFSWHTALVLACGYGILECASENNEVDTRMRTQSGGIDRSMRGGFLRRAYEEWKCSTGYRDEAVMPGVERSRVRDNWVRLVDDSRAVEGVTLTWFAKNAVTSTAGWSWRMNEYRSERPYGTFTGLRTPSSWWRTDLNVSWSTFNISGRPTPSDSIYKLDDGNAGLFYDHWTQFCEGRDDPQLERALNRLDLTMVDSWTPGLFYKTFPKGQASKGIMHLVDYSSGGRLAYRQGWAREGTVEPSNDWWGWGVRVFDKDFRNMTLRALVVSSGLYGIMAKREFTPGRTILFRGERDPNPVGVSQYTISKAFGFNVAKLKPRESGNGQGAQEADRVDLGKLTVEQLEGLIAKLKAAPSMEDQRRLLPTAAPEPSSVDSPTFPKSATTDRVPAAVVAADLAKVTKAVESITPTPDLLAEHGSSSQQVAMEEERAQRV